MTPQDDSLPGLHHCIHVPFVPENPSHVRGTSRFTGLPAAPLLPCSLPRLKSSRQSEWLACWTVTPGRLSLTADRAAVHNGPWPGAE